MARVSLTVNGRPFTVTCDDGQEARIRRLGQYVDAKVGEFVKSIGQVGEARLLLLAALVIADELAEANEALRFERSVARDAEAERRDGCRGRRHQWPRATGRSPCDASGDPLGLAMRGGAARRVRSHIAPGPIPTSWEPSLSKPWFRHMAPTCYGGPRRVCMPTAEAAPPCAAAPEPRSACRRQETGDPAL